MNEKYIFGLLKKFDFHVFLEKYPYIQKEQ